MSTCAMHMTDNGCVELRGILTRATVPNLWRERKVWLDDKASDVLVFDMQHVDKVDSAGVAMLLQVKRELRSRGRDIRIMSANNQFKAMVQVSGVGTLLTMTD